MKWSTLFASILGDKDTDVSEFLKSQNSNQNSSSPESEKQTTIQTAIKHVSQPESQSVNSTQHIIEQNQLTKEQFDALNARIKELETANKELLLKGTVDAPPIQSPEEIIYNLCVGRSNNNGKQLNTNTEQRGKS